MQIKGFIIAVIAFLIVQTHIAAQSFQIRSVNKGLGVIGVEMRVISGAPPTTSDKVTDIVFGLKWQSGYNVDLVSGITTNYNIKKSDVRKVKNGFYYQAFYADQTPYSFPSNWQMNNWVEILSIANTRTGSGTGSFFIAEKGFDITTDPNLGINLTDFAPAINDSALNVALPISLMEFNVAAEKSYIVARWQTSNEINNKGFELQRTENESVNFSPIAWLDSKGGGTINNYDFTDNKIEFDKDYFYRLKQVDKDGKEALSVVRRAKLSGEYSFKLSPNPANNVIIITSPVGFSSNKFTIKITDAKGITVYEAEEFLSNSHSKEITISSLSAGAYFLSLENAGNIIFRHSFVKA
jgi:hypothetical protein